MNGILNVLKPPGMTSHDVVFKLRKKLGIKKIGHTGTLDPMACGVLPLCLGKATKIIEYLPNDKKYRAYLILGKKTDSGDALGEIIYQGDFSKVNKENFLNILPLFIGEIKQIPPMTSAVRYKGKKLYELARKGIEVEREPRPATIFNLELVQWKENDGQKIAIIDVHCSAGTYIRTLCSDIGDALGCGAYMGFLLRTKAGDFQISHSLTLEEIFNRIENEILSSFLLNLRDIFKDMPKVVAKQSATRSLSCGASLYGKGVEKISSEVKTGQLVQIIYEDEPLAIARVEAEDKKIYFKPVKRLMD